MANEIARVELVSDINPDSNDGYSFSPSEFTVFEDQLYFSADNGENGIELFVSDGTAEGTQLLVDLNPGLNDYGFADSSEPSEFKVFGDELFFGADDGEVGSELFKLSFDDVDPVITGTNAADRLMGGDEAEQIDGLKGSDTLDGGKGDDTLTGGKGADLLIGGKGSDILDGGKGDDTLMGGKGADIFVLEVGQDTDVITDFQLEEDRLDLPEHLAYSHLSFAENRVELDGEPLVTLCDFNTENLTNADFTV